MLLVHLLAQAAAAATPEAVATQQQGVINYPPSFFAAQQPANAQEMLLRLPGFSIEVGDTIRGFEGGGGNVLIDGQRPTSKTDNLEELLRRIPAANIERIELIRGGAPGIDMQGKSVIANVVRKKGGSSFRGMVAFANNHLPDGRNMHGGRIELSGASGEREWEASARYGYGNDDGGDEGPVVRLAPNGQVLRNSQINGESDGVSKAVTAALRQPLFGGKIALNGRGFHEKWKSEEDHFSVTPGSAFLETTDDVYFTDETEFGARFDRDFGAKTKLELIGLRQDRQREITSVYASGGFTQDFRLDRDSSETIGRAVLKYRFNDELSFEGGAEAALNQLESQTTVFADRVQQAVPAADVEVEEKRGEVFVKGTWRPISTLTIDAGIRLEGSRISSDGDVLLKKELTFLKPRFAVSWQATPSTQIRGRFERVVGQLNFDDFVASSDFSGTGVSAGNPDLDPEQAWVSEVALEQRLWGATGVLTYRHSELSDVVDRGPVRSERIDPVTGQRVVSFFDTPMNIGDGVKNEVIGEVTIPLDRLGMKGGLLKGEINYRDSEVTDPTTLTERRISRLRPLEWNINFSQDLPQWQMSVGFDVYSGWDQITYRYNSITTVKLHNSYVKPFIEKRFPQGWTLRAELPNVFGRGIRFTREQFTGPRNTAPLAYVEDRDLDFGQMFWFRIRKTFGA
jgi:outer membrane receptor protein involved in Fe transport